MLDAAHVDDHLGCVPLVGHDVLHTRLRHLHGAALIRGGELPTLDECCEKSLLHYLRFKNTSFCFQPLHLIGSIYWLV